MAAPDPSWRTQISFSERLSATSSIVSAYRRSDPSAGFSKAHAEAQHIETRAFEEADSQEGYQNICQNAVERFDEKLQQGPQKDALAEAFADYDSASGIELGCYKKAVFVKETSVSTIFKAKCNSAGYVAIKSTVLTSKHRPHDPVRESQILKRVFAHQKSGTNCRVLPVLDAFKEAGDLYVLAFPYMPHNFEELLRHDEVSPGQVQSLLKDVFTALAHIHSLGIIHRDVKPSNILVQSPSGPAYLGDFGIAWGPEDKGADEEKSTEKITDVGTTCYRPPEVLFGDQSYGITLDLWAAGCVVAEAVNTGHQQLFDSGPLGSELALINSMFSTLGTPNDESWPSAQQHLPDWGKIQFKEYPPKPWEQILSHAPSHGRDLASKLVRFEESERLSAAEALKHSYFDNVRETISS